MQPEDVDRSLFSCSFMIDLIELLLDIPAQNNEACGQAISKRLEKLEFAACLHGAPEPTLAAIRGAWVLLDLAKRPSITLLARADIA